MLVPIGLPDCQRVASRFKHWDVRFLVRRVDNYQQDVDDRLGSQAGTEVEPTCSITKALRSKMDLIRSASLANNFGQAESYSLRKIGPLSFLGGGPTVARLICSSVNGLGKTD